MLSDGKIILNNQLSTLAAVNLLMNIQSSGVNGIVMATANISDASSTLYFSRQQCSWESNYTWWKTGKADVVSEMMMQNIANWNLTGRIAYGDNSYSFRFKEGIFSSPLDLELVVAGNGNYGGNWNNWLVFVII